MPEQAYRIIAAEESDLHDEPHIEGRRITVRFVHERVENGGLTPAMLADRHGLDLSDVYHALAYYHDHPAEMRHVEQRRRRTIEENREQATTGPDDL